MWVIRFCKFRGDAGGGANKSLKLYNSPSDHLGSFNGTLTSERKFYVVRP